MRNFAFLSFISAALLGLGVSACDGADDADGAPLQNQGDAGTDTSPSSGDGGGTTPGTQDPGSDAGSFTFITSAKCDELPGSFQDTDHEAGSAYQGVCVTIDWTDNPCTITQVACGPNTVFFDWEHKPGGYFNLKFMEGTDVVSSTAGTVNRLAPPTTLPATVTDLPEGVDIMVRALDPDGNHYQMTFRRDGDVITVVSIMKMAV